MKLNYRAVNKSCHFPVGALPLGAKLLLNVSGEDIEKLYLVITKDGENPVEYEFNCDNGVFRIELEITSAGLYFYTFKAFDGEKYEYFGKDAALCAYKGGPPFTQLVYRFLPRADLLGGGLVYQIFPDRFCIGGKRLKTKKEVMRYRDDWGGVPEFLPKDGKVLNNDMFGGNLKGIIKKLDYLKELGVTCLYLNPIFEAFSNHKYNTADYLKIDSDFGTESDFKDLVSECNKRGMIVILDGVFSHTGDDSVYFDKYGRYGEGAYGSKESKYYNWYRFTEYPNKYESWWGIDTLPNVNETEPSYIEFITNEVVKKWTDFGVSGFRLDVADELPDEFLDAFFASLYGKDCVIIGEVWENAATKISYSQRRRYFTGGQLDGVTDYPLRKAIIDFVRGGNADLLDSVVSELVNDYPPHALNNLFNILSTHDTVRILNALSDTPISEDKAKRAVAKLDDYPEAKKRLMIAAALQYTLPGVPCLFYGDEVGVRGYEDPFCRACYPWGNEDRELLDFYKRLGKLRQEKVFDGGDYKLVTANKGLIVFSRGLQRERLTVIVNSGEKAVVNEFKGKRDIFNGKLFGGAADKYGFYVLKD